MCVKSDEYEIFTQPHTYFVDSKLSSDPINQKWFCIYFSRAHNIMPQAAAMNNRYSVCIMCLPTHINTTHWVHT